MLAANGANERMPTTTSAVADGWDLQAPANVTLPKALGRYRRGPIE